MSSYELPANASEDVLRRKIAEVRGKLHSLNISNCIVAVPAFLLSLASDLRNLQTLSCIACPLKASLLLDRLLTSLQTVTQLDFSLVDAMDDAKEELVKIRHLGIVHGGKETKISKMYVEVADKHNMKVLLLFLNYCPLLRDLHVHFVHELSSDLCAATCSSIADHLFNLVTFTVTCEAPSTAKSDPRQPIDLRYCIDLHGNAVFRKRPLAFNCAQLRNLVLSPKPTFPLEPVVLVAVDRPDLGFFVGVLLHNWSQLRSLCVLLYARNLDQAVYPTISTLHRAALRNFFATLLNLVELNVSSFHFGDGVDFTELLAAPALQRLRALSLPPCGLRPEGAVRRLALGLGDVEDLDIRLNLDGRHKSCPSCAKELTIEPADASAFCIGSGRLTLSNVPNLVSVNFLPHFKMPHLRFIDGSDVPRFDYRALSRALRSSKTLRSLVIRMALINFNELSFVTLLRPASALERLCLLTKTKLQASKAEMVVQAMARQLPSIFYIHIHYVDIETDSETTVTWIRRPEGEAARPSSRPSVMPGKPCIMCSTQTFVALAKPLYRELL
ncbi:uncharacterized protein LOC119393561 [Rhipicephalus sanguineus]|uniref:Uncharacterized protein n=1 Tax=Rhipicephalus sanguineus TaxID=34632 RepID=A0A9D4TAU9_RHISA|nr:uncharacterized protein LOC119393561 [Rhipicephalus sanguineus]KAH7984040.1 hypothetical protein HPB52_016505 [Rhipicephalus sanguineus]